MNTKQLKEILASHADQLVTNQVNGNHDFQCPPDTEDELATLLKVAEQVKSALKPISPLQQFEADLKRELLTTAHLRKAEGYIPPNPGRDLLVFTAMIGFVVSIASLLVARRLRSQSM